MIKGLQGLLTLSLAFLLTTCGCDDTEAKQIEITGVRSKAYRITEYNESLTVTEHLPQEWGEGISYDSLLFYLAFDFDTTKNVFLDFDPCNPASIRFATYLDEFTIKSNKEINELAAGANLSSLFLFSTSLYWDDFGSQRIDYAEELETGLYFRLSSNFDTSKIHNLTITFNFSNSTLDGFSLIH